MTSGTPWISFYTPEEIVALATSAGFDDVRCVTTAEVSQRYLAERSDANDRPQDGERAQ